MTFLVAAALSIALLAVIPVVAHLLRRGQAQEREFPPARWVPPAPPVARRRSRLEDRALLAVRGLLILGLALLGAVPFVRCSRLAVNRHEGASVAMAIVLDDSASMRLSTPTGRQRWERALSAARELLRTAREGDAVTLVLAGKPVRLALAATTDLTAARAALASLEVSDRATELGAAVALARSALAELPHQDRRLVLLSDLAGDELPAGDPAPWIPLPDLTQPVPNCGIVRALRRGPGVTVEVGCNGDAAGSERRVEVVVAPPAPPASGDAPPASTSPRPIGAVLNTAALAARPGTQSLVLDIDPLFTSLDVRLTGDDAGPHDDLAPVAPEQTATTIAVLGDPTTTTAQTGGPPVLEQALQALELGILLRPLTLLPDETAGLDPFAALLLDDPAGLGPEMRQALEPWLERGGVALALLGPRVGRAQLGATLSPFVTAAVIWSPLAPGGIAAETAIPIGPEAAGLAALAPRGRVALEGSVPDGARILARWSDGAPFLFSRDVGRGLVITLGLPSSPLESDLALRPAFLALLTWVVDEARRRQGPQQSVAGSTWSFEGDPRPRLTLPTGSELTLLPSGGADGTSNRTVYTPGERGRYIIHRGQDRELRVVTLTAEELTHRPRTSAELTPEIATGNGSGRVEASGQIAVALLLLLALELLLRARVSLHQRHRSPGSGENLAG